MIYCKKCSRLFEKESDICPYCGESEEAEQADMNLNSQLDDKIYELNVIIDEKKEKSETNNGNAVPPVIDAVPAKTPEAGGNITQGMRLLLILVSIFIAPAGIIAGAVYMAKDAKEYRVLGKTMLITAIISIVFFIICCCGSYVYFMNNFFTDIMEMYSF